MLSVNRKRHPTKRAADGGDSAAFSGFFYAQAESALEVLSTAAPPPLTQTVRQQFVAPAKGQFYETSAFSHQSPKALLRGV